MDENNVQTTEMETTETNDAFLDGWDAPDSVPTYDSADVDESIESAETTDADDENTGEEAQADGEQSDTTAEETTAETTEPKQWDINLLGVQKKVSVDEITPTLLQKGFDYDRIHQKWDEAKPVMAMFAPLAEKAGMSVVEYTKFVRQQMKQAEGLSEEEAARTVDLEDRETAVALAEENKNNADSAKADADNKMKADLADFEQAFPEIYKDAKSNPKVIPESVWADVNKGMTLTAAYAKYAVAEANKAKADAEHKATVTTQNAKNAARSAGSMKSAGNDMRSKDPFLDGWDS